MTCGLAAAVATLHGVPWRLHGRDPCTGLDCVGVLAAGLAAIGRPAQLPTGYSLRLTRLDDWLPDPAALGLQPATGPIEPGDVLLLSTAPAQFHLAIAGPDQDWIHAHAGLRRVVRQKLRPDGQEVGRWRLIS